MKGVILAAGYATRFLPASKTIPKEMFPLIDRPAIDFIVQEMVDSGINDILLVSSRRKKVMEDYFDREVELSSAFSQSNEIEKLEVIKPIEANFFTLRQQDMMGTGNALMLVEPFVDNQPFVVAYPDDIVLGEKPLSRQLIETWEKTGNTVLAVKELEEDQLYRYGVIAPVDSYGRYLYTPDLFEALKNSDRSHSGRSEFTQTEAINYLAAEGNVSAVQFEGTRYDLGEPLGFLTSALQIGLQRPEYKESLLDEIRRLLELHDSPDNENSG